MQRRLGRHMTPARIQQMSLVFIGILVIGSISFFGSLQKRDSLASTSATMYATPASGNYKAGSTIEVAVRADSGDVEVNSVQAALQYDTTRLEYLGVDEGSAFPFVAATSTDVPGQVRIARGVNIGASGVTGDNLVATVRFRVLPGAGTVNIFFNTAFSLIVSSKDNNNILVSSLGASYRIE